MEEINMSNNDRLTVRRFGPYVRPARGTVADPFQLLDSLFAEIDRPATSNPTFRTEGDFYRTELLVPGADRKDVSVSVTDRGTLVVKYKASNPNRFCADFSYEWTLGDIDASSISASCVDGVLYLTVPKTQKTKTTFTVPVN